MRPATAARAITTRAITTRYQPQSAQSVRESLRRYRRTASAGRQREREPQPWPPHAAGAARRRCRRRRGVLAARRRGRLCTRRRRDAATSDQVRVVGEAWDGQSAVDQARTLLPDVVLLDVRMPRRDGGSAAREIALHSRVLMTTFTDDHDVVREAVAAGAAGYLVHGTFAVEDLVASVLAVARGAGMFSAGALEALRTPAAIPSATTLTPEQRGAVLGLSTRQSEIVDLISAGLSNAEIAVRCYLSEKTVKNHINRIFATLGVRHRAEAVSLWLGRTDHPGGGPIPGP